MVTQVATSTENKTARHELNPGFEGETMTLKDAVDHSGQSKVTVLKKIKDNKIQPVGKIVSGSRGRPANLYDKNELMNAIK